MDSAPQSPTPRSLSLGTRASNIIRGSVLARFASVGVVNTLVDLILYVVLVGLGLGIVLANFLSTSAGMAVSFAGNRRFVFGGTGNRAREIALFVIVCGVGIWVIQPLVILWTGSALDGLTDLPSVVVSSVPKILAILVAAVWNYLLYSRLVFRSERNPERHDEVT